MQNLVFAPRAYYFEIIESDARMFLLKKVPEKGYLSVKTITYHLYDRHYFQCLIRDICDTGKNCRRSPPAETHR